ncbi:MAG: hypothetical protein HQ559_03150 [Lentisphaerae bacterium]|nr:hypothetical protein [Lentisphaerota bacterium]
MDSLLASFAIAFRFSLLGAAWTWTLPDSLLRGERPWQRFLFAGAASSMIAVPLGALVVLVLGEMGKYTAGIELACLAALTALGIGAGLALRARALRTRVLEALPAAAFLAISAIVLWIVPARGEWLPGSWDPGVYLNEAAALERTGTFHPPDRFFYEELTPDERIPFSRIGLGRHERFPGVIADSKRKAFGFTFFRLAPAIFATIARAGGMHMLHRANAILAALVLLSFAALVFKVHSRAGAVFSLLLLVSQPMLIYHTHVPLSEMLQLYLLCSLFFLLPQRNQGRAAYFLGLVLLAAMIVNRFSFLPFAGLLIATVAWIDIPSPWGARKVLARLGLCAAVIAGGLADMYLSRTSIVSWAITPLLLMATGFLLVVAFLIDLITVKRLLRRLNPWTLELAVIVAAIVLGLLLTRDRLMPQKEDTDNLVRLLPFVGALPVLLAFGGTGAVIRRWSDTDRVLQGILLFLLAATALLLFRKNIADLYPWATRRYLPFAVPLVSLLGGASLAWLWGSARAPRLGKAAACVAFALVLILHGKTIRASWTYADFNGVTDLLERIADPIDDDDIVVADHPRWGTPLALLYGKQVLNGQPMWRDASGKKAADGFRALERLAANGKRVRFLTSSDKGIKLYPVRVKTEGPTWSSGPTTLEEIIHHPRASRFALQPRERTFRLYTLATPGKSQ